MVLKVVAVNFIALWNLMPCSLVKIYLLIRLHVHGVPCCTLNGGVHFSETSVNVDVLLTVHLGIFISVFVSCTPVHETAAYRCENTRDRIIQF